MIEADSLTKHYGDFTAVWDLSFRVEPGQIMGLVGPNGAGKTTTLRCLAGVIPPSAGFVRLCGHDMATAPVKAKQELAWLTDEPRLFPNLSVRQHLEFTARLYQTGDCGDYAKQLLADLDLTEVATDLPGSLSRGMQQKVALACGLLHRPRVMLFDEPLTGLDPIAIRRTREMIARQARDGVAIIISSHLLHLVDELCSHLLVMKKGRAAFFGTMEDLRITHGTDLEEVYVKLAGDSGNAPAGT